ncbi:hypothetical protein QDR37_11765 [Amnibacterium sp. CER49]|uniref:hypothetical protein n=1 Tax=Amnibacterium sp. CER49 TaxID=3039161 RepID=UPI002446F9B7|nr:hypothetical protein [Amnibacterium sp. CER49]MDH2444623.1 hypothetical protein [Amnibacterium sp. CER49]
MTAAPPVRTAGWHLAGHHLWLGRVEGEDVGVIENDGRYAAIGASGVVRGVFPTLWQAQLALEGAPV